jgi:hypothetical protein
MRALIKSRTGDGRTRLRLEGRGAIGRCKGESVVSMALIGSTNEALRRSVTPCYADTQEELAFKTGENVSCGI